MNSTSTNDKFSRNRSILALLLIVPQSSIGDLINGACAWCHRARDRARLWDLDVGIADRVASIYRSPATKIEMFSAC